MRLTLSPARLPHPIPYQGSKRNLASLIAPYVMTARNIDRLNEMIRADSPLGRQMLGPLGDWGRRGRHSKCARRRAI
jgi:hypothetical protein